MAHVEVVRVVAKQSANACVVHQAPDRWIARIHPRPIFNIIIDSSFSTSFVNIHVDNLPPMKNWWFRQR